MKVKSQIGKRMISIVLTLALLVSGITFCPTKVRAAGWLDYANQTITLGTSISASMKDGDYYGRTEAVPSYGNGIDVYWHIYKFSMPKDGLLNIYLESISEAYLKYQTGTSYILGANGFVIYSVSNPDNIVWRSISSQNRIPINYSTSRNMYYGSTEIALEGGEYYFAVRQRNTNNNPYYLTLSYKAPIVNVSSISLDPTSLSMELGSQQTIVPTVLPNNATDKTVTWQSGNPSIATVDNSGVVTALSVGSVTITASSADGEITASCPVVIRCEHNYKTSLIPASTEKEGSVTKTCSKCKAEIKTPIPRIENIELSQTTYTYDGKEHQPDVTVTDEEDNTLEAGKDYTVSYPENTTDIGTHTVTIEFKGNYEGTKTKSFTISPIPVKSISLDPSQLTMDIGSQQKITATVLPENATDKTITWQSVDPTIATVEDGTVTALTVGTTAITASSADGEITVSCPVVIKCEHNYKTSIVPADTEKEGAVTKTCDKCKAETKTLIPRIENIELSQTTYTYDGKEHQPDVTVTDEEDNTLEAGKDYTVSYPENTTDIGTHTVTIEFKGNYEGTQTRNFTISPILVESISLDPSQLTMDIGSQQKITTTVLPDNATDKTVTWQSVDPTIATVEDGTVTALTVGTTAITASSADGEITVSCPVVIKCEHNYKTSIILADTEKEGSITQICDKCGEEVKVSIPRIENIELSQTTYTYDGKEHQPNVIVTDEDGNTLESGKDYTASYSENTISIGTHTVTINFIGNYEGTQSLSYTVSPVHVDSIYLTPSRLTLNIGLEQKITATIFPENATDKTIVWQSTNPSVATVKDGVVMAVSVGTATITAVTADGEETAKCMVSVTCPHYYHTTLIPAGKNDNGSLKEECTKCGNIRQDVMIYAIDEVSLSKRSYTYTGKTCTPIVIVKDRSGRTLEQDKDYTTAYSGNRKDVGIYNVVVTFKGNYTGTETKQFTIYPKSTKFITVKPRRKGFTVNWKKQSAQISGYELAYSTNSKFRGSKVRLLTISKNKARKTVVRLGRRKKYYVRIRTYKNVSLNGKTTKLYSGWSKTKTVRTKE